MPVRQRRRDPVRGAAAWLVTALVLVSPSCRHAGGDDAETAWVDQQRTLYHGIPARVEFALPASRAPQAAEVAARAWAEFDRVGEVVNAFSPSSEVGRLNGLHKTGPVAVSPDLDELLRLAAEAWVATDGAFDPTVWPLKGLWREAERTGQLPASPSVAAVMRDVGFDRVHASGAATWTFDAPDAALDLGGIAKGWAVDRVVDRLRAAGAVSALVQCGGEIGAFGAARAGGSWRIGVSDPLGAADPWGVISRSGPVSVSTTGNYEQPATVGGREYYHVFDPRTGAPIPTDVLGVTVVLLEGAWANARADALATGLAVLGPERGLERVDRIPGAAALFLVKDGRGGIRELASSRMAAVFARR